MEGLRLSHCDWLGTINWRSRLAERQMCVCGLGTTHAGCEIDSEGPPTLHITIRTLLTHDTTTHTHRHTHTHTHTPQECVGTATLDTRRTNPHTHTHTHTHTHQECVWA